MYSKIHENKKDKYNMIYNTSDLQYTYEYLKSLTSSQANVL